jgi:phosphatidylglycerophosphatase A
LKILFGTGLYTGYIPIMPATFASLLAVPLVLLLARSVMLYALVTVLVFFLGVYLATDLEKLWGKDAGRITIDEICGMLVVFFYIRPTLKALVIGFILFRAFDILKLPFVKKVENLKGGWGVMLDDVIAGVMANLLLRFKPFH